MSKQEFKGVLSTGDACRCNEDMENYGAILIGDTDIIGEPDDTDGPIKVTLNGEVIAEGQSFIELGWGDVWEVGGESLIETLEAHAGKEVCLVIESTEE